MRDRFDMTTLGPTHPIKLDDAYPCRGEDAEGNEVVYDDLLGEGDIVALWTDQHGNTFGRARVVRHDDGLWVEQTTPTPGVQP